MKYIIFFTLIFILVMPGAFAQKQLLDRVVAVVNNDAITQSELDVLLRPVYGEYQEAYRGPELIEKMNEARQTILNQLIEDRLVFQKAKELAIEVPTTAIEEQMEAFGKQFGSNAEMEDMMTEQGLTTAIMEERIRKQIMIRELHNREVRSFVVVAPGEIEEYYRTHPEEFATEASIKIRSFTIKKGDEARRNGIIDEVAKKKIEEFRTRLIAGEDFETMAKENSQDTRAANGGLSDWLQQGTMIPVIDEVIFGLKLGELSNIVETSMGYHLFRLEERREGATRSLEDVRAILYDKIFGEKADVRFQEWMDELKHSAYITIR